MHRQRQIAFKLLTAVVLSLNLSSTLAAPLLAGTGGKFLTQVVFDVELNNTSPGAVTNVEVLKGTFGQVDYQSPWKTWQEATISRVYMTSNCNVTNVQWHLDFRVEYSSKSSWTLDSNWKANLQQWYPGAKISTATATQTTTSATPQTTSITTMSTTASTSGSGYYTGSNTTNTTSFVLEFSASYLGFGNRTAANDMLNSTAVWKNITTYLQTVANATTTPLISVVPAVEFAVSCKQLPNGYNTWFNQGLFLQYLNGLSRLPLNGGYAPAQVLAISLSPDAADSANVTNITAIFSQFATNLTLNDTKISQCTTSTGCQAGCSSMGVCLPQGKLTAQDLICQQLTTPFECEALGGALCFGVYGDISEVALAHWYTNDQYKWPYSDSHDAVNKFMGSFVSTSPMGGSSMSTNQSTGYYGWWLQTIPETQKPAGFKCAPRSIQSCLYNSNQFGCASNAYAGAACQWTPVCLPDPCSSSADPCCGARGYLCEETKLPPEVSGRCVLNMTNANPNATWFGKCEFQPIDCSQPRLLSTEDRVTCRVVEAVKKLDGTTDPCIVGGICASSTDASKLCSACKELSASMNVLQDRLQSEAASCQSASISTVAPAASTSARKRRHLFQAPTLPTVDTITNMTADMQQQVIGTVLGSLIYAQEMCGDIVTRMGPSIGLASTNVTAVCLASGYNSSYYGDGPSADMSLDDCVHGIGMYSAIVKSGALNGYSNATLGDFCMSMMLEGLDAMKDKVMPDFGGSSDCSRLPQDQCQSNPGCFVSESCEVDDDSEATFCSFFNSNKTACETQPACMYVPSTDPTDCEVLELVVKAYGRAILTNGTAWCTTVGDCDSGCGSNCTDCKTCLDFHKTTLSPLASSASDTEAGSVVKTACLALTVQQPSAIAASGRRMQQVTEGACAAKNATRCYLASSKESCPWESCSYRTACSSPSASTCDHATGSTLASCEAHAICEVAIDALAAGQPVAGTICKDLCTTATDPACTQCQDQVADLVTKLAPAPRHSCFGMLNTPTQYQICFPAVAAVVAAGQKCQGVGDLLPALMNSTAKFCTDAGVYNSWCLELFAPTALAMMSSGFYPQSPAGLEAFCNRAAPFEAPEAFMTEFGRYECNADDDICCPDWGAKYSKDKCSQETNNVCQPAGECSVAKDSCYEAYKQSAATGIPACPPACDKMPFSGYAGVYQPVDDNGVGTLCYNSTLWDACLAAEDDVVCNSIQDASKQPLCSFQPSCSVPPTADYGCRTDSDPCCVSSPTELFSVSQQVDCKNQSYAGAQCSIQNQCMQMVDPCAAYRTPWDCNSDENCLFFSTGDSMSAFGGVCVSSQDPCPALSASACEQQKVILGDRFVSRCRLIDRCKSNFCDPKDACCAFSNDFLQCFTTTGCTPDSKCLPEFDSCKDLSAAACSAASYCSYNVTTKRCQMDIAKHPCSSISDPFDCSTSTDQCLAIPLCVNGCTVCEQCLKSAYNEVVLPASLIDLTKTPDQAVSIFNQWCSKNDRYAGSCDSLADIILSYPTFALRAGMLCSGLAACDSSANCTLQSTKSLTTKSPLQLCSADGTTGTTATTQLAVSAGQCSSDSHCASGETCEIGASATTQCICEDGFDVCYTFGTCKAVCQTELYQSTLADLQAYYQTCQISNTTSCPTDMACQSSTDCVTWTCSQGNFIASDCASGIGLCVDSQPTVVTATFADTKDTVTVALDTFAATSSFPCSAIFDETTSGKLGALSQCSVSGKQLTISLRGDAQLAVSNGLTLAASQNLLVDSVRKTPFTGSVASVSKCSACSSPVAVVTAPATVVKPCNSTDAATIVFDGTRSRDSSGRPFTSVAWALTSGVSAQITAAFQAATTLGATKASSAMYLTVATTDLVVDTTYTFTFTVTNFLGDTHTYTGSFTVVASGTVPMVRVLGGLSQSFSISKGIFLFADVDSKTVCASSTVSVNWRCTTSTIAGVSSACSLTPTAGVSTLNLAIPSVKAIQDQVFTFTLTAAIVGKENLASTTTVTLKAIASPLQPVIDGPTGDVAFGSVATFDSSNSQDPDDVTSSGAPTWDCYVRGSPLQKCPAAALVRLPKSLQVNTSSLALNTQYVVALTMKKDVRSATATVAITPRPGDTPTGRAKRQCGWDRATDAPRVCPSKHNRGDNLVVMLELDSNFKAASVVWSLDPTTMTGQLSSSNANGINTPTLVVMAFALPTGNVDLIANISYNGAYGASRLSVPINTPPKCTDAASCFSATPVSSTLGSAVQGSTFGWDGIYSYEFGVLKRGVYTPSAVANPATAFSYTGLPVGNSTLYVCAVDDFGARTCQTQAVTVSVPTVTGEQLILNELPKYTVDSLISAKNPAVLMSSVCQLGALLKFVRGQNSVVAEQTMTLVQDRIEALITEMGKPEWFPGKSDTAASGQMVAAMNCLAPVAFKPLSAAINTILVNSAMACIPANKPITTAQSNSVCSAVSSTKSSSASGGTSPKRRLQQTTTTTTTTTTQSQYKTITSAIKQARDAYCSNAQPGVGFLISGSESIYFSCAIETASNLNGMKSGLGDTSARRRLLQSNNASSAISYTLPSNYNAWCTANPTACGTTTSVSLTYYAAPATWYSAAITNYASMPVADPTATDVRLSSGVLEIGVGGRADICNATTACTLSADMPIADYNSSRLYACVLLTPSGSGTYLAVSTNITTSAATSTQVTCSTSKTGSVIVASYVIPPLPSPKPLPSPSPKPQAGLNETNTTTSTSPKPSPSPSPAVVGADNSTKVNLLTMNYTDSKTVPSGPSVVMSLRFSFSYDSIKNQTAKNDFLRTVRVGIAYNLGMRIKEFRDANGNPDISRVQIVGEPRPGSIIVDTKFVFPTSWNSTAVEIFAATITAQPNLLFQGTILDGSVLSAKRADTKSSKGLSGGAIAGIVIGVIAGVAITAGLVYVFVIRKRSQTVQPGGR